MPGSCLSDSLPNQGDLVEYKGRRSEVLSTKGQITNRKAFVHIEMRSCPRRRHCRSRPRSHSTAPLASISRVTARRAPQRHPGKHQAVQLFPGGGKDRKALVGPNRMEGRVCRRSRAPAAAGAHRGGRRPVTPRCAQGDQKEDGVPLRRRLLVRLPGRGDLRGGFSISAPTRSQRRAPRAARPPTRRERAQLQVPCEFVGAALAFMEDGCECLCEPPPSAPTAPTLPSCRERVPLPVPPRALRPCAPRYPECVRRAGRAGQGGLVRRRRGVFRAPPTQGQVPGAPPPAPPLCETPAGCEAALGHRKGVFVLLVLGPPGAGACANLHPLQARGR